MHHHGSVSFTASSASVIRRFHGSGWTLKSMLQALAPLVPAGHSSACWLVEATFSVYGNGTMLFQLERRRHTNFLDSSSPVSVALKTWRMTTKRSRLP
jgi:hypothetical protein